jgi:hypothetical protein
LHDAAHDDVFNRRRIKVITVGNGIEHGSAQIDGVNARKLTTAAATGGTNRIDNISVCHFLSPVVQI